MFEIKPESKNLIWVFVVGISISSLAFSSWVLDYTLVPRFFCLTLTLLIFVYSVYKSNSIKNIPFDFLIFSYSGYVIFSALSTVWSLNKAESLFESSRILLGFFVFVSVCFLFQKGESYFSDKICKSAVIIALITCISAGFQIWQLPDLKKESMYLVTGINGHKNLLSSFLFLIIFFLLLAINELTRVWKYVTLILIVGGVCLIILLRTKAVWIGIIFTAFSYVSILFFNRFFNRNTSRRKIYISIFVFVILSNLFFGLVLSPIIKKGIRHNQSRIERSNSEKTELDNERLVVWDKTYLMIQKHPLIGVGSGNWQIHFPEATLRGLWRAQELNVTFQRPHNDFLWILSEGGYVGFTLFLFFIIGIVILTFFSIRSDENKMQSTLAVAFVCGYLTISFFDFPKERAEHILWVNILFGRMYWGIRKNFCEKSWFSLPFNKTTYRIMMSSLCFILLLTSLRVKGEYFTKRLYDYRASNDQINIIKTGKSAWSFAYNIDPTSIPLDWYSGNANAAMGNYLDAQKNFQAAHKFNPNNPNVLNDLASSYSMNGDTNSAISLYKKASEINPRLDAPKLNLAAIYIAENKLKQAKTFLDSIYHDGEKRKSYYQIIELLSERQTKN